jgi:uncharacterized Ntn-hydrolase superfamily protein
MAMADAPSPRPALATFSIVGFDPQTRDLGVAVQSKFLAVGAVVPWAEARVGAVATQAYANTSYGPRTLRLLRQGVAPERAIGLVTSRDKERDKRQVGVVDARGRAAAFTGSECVEWAGHLTGANFCALGNIVAGEAVLEAMARTFETTTGDLCDKLLAALDAGQRAGGDRRGQQSAALLIVREGGGYGGFNDRWVDLRVDDHPKPIDELRRVFEIHNLMALTREDPKDLVPLVGGTVEKLQRFLSQEGMYTAKATGVYDDATRQALRAWFGVNNFEAKWRDDANIWASVWRYIERRIRP